MTAPHVRPPVKPLTDADARHLLADGLIRVCHAQGPSRVALTIGCDEKTVRRARDEDSTLGLSSAVNLLLADPKALDALLASVGYRPVPLNSKCDTDNALPSTSAAVLKLAIAKSPASPGGVDLVECELIDMEAEVAAAEEHLAALRVLIADAKLRRAA